MGGLLHLVQRGGAYAGCGPASPLLAVADVTAHPSMASVPTSYYSMWHYHYLWTLKDISTGVGTGGAGSEVAPPTFGVLE